MVKDVLIANLLTITIIAVLYLNYLLIGECLVVFFLAFLTSVVLRKVKHTVVMDIESTIQKSFYLTKHTYLVWFLKYLYRNGVVQTGGRVHHHLWTNEFQWTNISNVLLVFTVYLAGKFNPAYLIVIYCLILVVKLILDLACCVLIPTGLDNLFIAEDEEYCYTIIKTRPNSYRPNNCENDCERKHLRPCF